MTTEERLDDLEKRVAKLEKPWSMLTRSVCDLPKDYPTFNVGMIALAKDSKITGCAPGLPIDGTCRDITSQRKI